MNPQVFAVDAFHVLVLLLLQDSLPAVLVRLVGVVVHEVLDAAWLYLSVVAVVAELHCVRLAVAEVADVVVAKVPAFFRCKFCHDVAHALLVYYVVACHLSVGFMSCLTINEQCLPKARSM